MLYFGSDFCLLKVSVKVQDKDFTVRPVSPMYGSEDLLFKGGPNSMSQIVPSETYQNYRWHLTLDTDWPKKMTRWRIDKKGEHWGANPITTLSKNINNNLQPNTITSKNKFSDGESVEQQLTIIPRLTNKRRGSIADHAFPELHQKVVEIKKITWVDRTKIKMWMGKKHV